MKTPEKLNALIISLVCLAMIAITGSAVYAVGTVSNAGAFPGAATSNSMFEFYLTYADNPQQGNALYPIAVGLYIDGGLVAAYYGDGYQGQTADFDPPPGHLRSGVRYAFRVSAGLDLMGSGFYPNNLFTDISNLWRKTIVCTWLVANGDGSPQSHHWLLRVVYQGEPVGGQTPAPVVIDNEGDIKVHDSYYRSANPRVIRYGGKSGDRDSLLNWPTGYPFYDETLNPDPLKVSPYQTQFPDEGSSTSTYTFRTRYTNVDGLPPRAWTGDPWNIGVDYSAGVMVYLRNLDMSGDPYWGQFHGHYMYKVDPAAPDGDAHWILNVLPIGNNIIGVNSGSWLTTWSWTAVTNHFYEALPPGRYEYYFACSDDNFDAFGLAGDRNTIFQYLEPSPAMPVPSPPNYADPFFSSNGINWLTEDSQHGYVDKRTMMPGAWTNGYPYDSWKGATSPTGMKNLNGWQIFYPAYSYPEVDPGLYQVGGTFPNGMARFLGTLSPYKRSVIAQLPTGDPNYPYLTDFGMSRMWSETAGGTDKDVFTFQVNYWQSHAVAPSYVRLHIKNAWNPDDPTKPWQSYDMFPSGPTPYNYRTGVTYSRQLGFTQLGYGPHCYYFEASDQTWQDTDYLAQTGIQVTVGSKVCRYPRRPDTIKYNAGTYYDGSLPAKSPNPDEDTYFPVENDVINGPYINHRPTLTNMGVSPPAGSSGTEFVYKVKYSDPDNQRPYTPYVIIESDDSGTTFTGSMVRSPDSSEPGNSTKTYAEGVVYEFRTSSAPGLKLQTGNRNYRFEFTDDWGRPAFQDDRVIGETVSLPDAGWLAGPFVSGNSAPRLSQGSVTSADGSSNTATMWNYKVTYTDADNNQPSYILVFIGRQDTPTVPIVWDAGHAMTETLPTDIVLSDGKEYQFSSRLPGSNTQPIKYYSAFVASDGIDPADYNATTSPSSGMVWKTAQTLTAVSGSPSLYDFGHKPLVVDVPPSSPLMPLTGYTSPLVYANGSSTPLVSGTDYNLDAINGRVSIINGSAPIMSRYWFGTEPGTNGPVAVTGNHAPSLEVGQVNPQTGTSTTMFTYTVTYKDLDGQAPQFINVVIDDVRHTMINVRGSTAYKTGVEYQFAMILTTGTHQFYFEASDGADLAIFDSDLSNATIEPIVGPYINDRPTLTNAQITPSGNIDQGQPVVYTVTVTDRDNDQPLFGYPVVYIDNPNETDWVGTVAAVADNKIVDSTQSWTPNQFNGMPVVVDALDINGNINPIVFKIDHNTATELYLVATADEVSGIFTGSQYAIGKLLMQKQDPSDVIFSDGVVYEAKVPSLGIGTHKAHFKAVIHEQTQPGVFTDTTLRNPATGDLSGPTVEALAPAGNVAPVLANGGVTPRTGTAVTAFRFAVTYSDANGDSPKNAHDGVTGYIRMQIEESPGNWVIHDLSTDIDAPNYSAGVEYSVTLSGLTLGPHNFFFETSDGWTTARFPSSGYDTVYVSRPPVLVEGAVIPVSGNTGRVYEYRVKYKDPDNDPPAYIKLVVDGGAPIDIGVPAPGADYINGAVYSYPLLKGSLTEGLHNFYFIASDGNGYAWYDKDVRDQEDAHNPSPVKNSTTSTPPTAVVPIDGPSVHSNTTPRLLNGHVLPGNGFDQDTYTYTVTYQDPDNDEPEYVECYIDDPNPLAPNAQRAYKMTKDPNSSDFVAGVNYTLTKIGLAPGSHTFYFRASDWLVTVYYPADGSGNPLSPIAGPTVATRGTATVNLTVPASITIGSTATVTGSVVGYGGTALVGIPVKIKITKPDGTVITPQPVVTTNGLGQFTYPEGTATWQPSVTGTWKIQATWVGNTQYLASSSAEKTLSVVGPSFTVNGLDMISLPIQPLSSFPDGALGSVPGFALAKWLPSKLAYKMYTLLPGVGTTDYDFPGITTGQAYWIKTLVPKTIAPTGTLVDQNSDYQVSLGVGWNQIGYPFTTECQWSDLRVRRTVNGVVQEATLAAAAANGWLKEYGWTYDPASGNYKLVDASRVGAERTMRPWRGYWMKALMYCTLVIPSPTRAKSASPVISLNAVDGQSGGTGSAKWQVRLMARNGDLKDEFNYFGESSSKEELVESPACFQNYIDLYFTTKHGDGMYASHLLDDAGFGDEWQFVVATDKVGEVELTWDGLQSVPSRIKLVLIDEGGKVTQIVPGGSYKFTAGEGTTTKSFKIEVRKS